MNETHFLLRLLPQLSPLEVFDVYDGPRFYSCRDAAGQIFLVYWIDETEARTTWLYLRVSQERYTSLKRGVMSVASVLAEPEEGCAYVVHSSPAGPTVEEIRTAQIDPEWLPPADERLSLTTGTLPDRVAPAVETALGSRRHVLDLALEKTSNTYEMSCGKLGKLLDAIQNSVFALACGTDRDVRRVPEELKFSNELLVTGVFASSFGVRLKTRGSDLFSSDETARALRTFTELLSALNTPDDLLEDLHRFNILARSRFKHLLRMFIEAEVSVSADWGAPSGDTHQGRASFPEIRGALLKLEAAHNATTQTVKRQGRLVGVDVKSNFFALVVGDDEVLKGTLAPSIARRQFEIPSEIRATLEETCVVDPLTDREKWSYVLLDVVQQQD
ncbi:DUF6575 domain-containing protein [Zeimonas arvi]|uniref:DUF6575 domain-containing protein n=1 Tax=Zeimonas arvi TaxID=2498847 RepID=A0A5C8NLD7_9BURK|nr:DUF6575 domain-containing protein [Zeimonas arvi]TXL62664.1 hypothetical protein FHP08_17730 [Zeimonas arvi]